MGAHSSTNKRNSERKGDLDTEPEVDVGLLYKKLNFLVIGRTGNGKSASCNAIAGVPEDDPIFVSYASSTAITKTVCNYRMDRWGKEISVTDTPGLADTELDEIGNVRFAKKNMINAMKICPEGFHAIVFVLSYQNHFSAEEQNVIKVLTEIFGEEIFEFSILIFTHGDDFDRKKSITNENSSQKMFKTWCKEQKGELKTLLERCNFRAVLFHNNKHYDGKRNADLIELIRQTEFILQKGKLYTNEQFQRCQDRRDHLLLNYFLDELKEQISKSLESLKQELILLTSQEKKIIEKVDKVLEDLPSKSQDLEILTDILKDLKVKLQPKMKNQDKCKLYTDLKQEIDTQLFLSLKSLSDDLNKAIKPELHKEDLRHRAMALKNYIYEEDRGTNKLRDEMEQVNYFLSELNGLDTKGKGKYTEIK